MNWEQRLQESQQFVDQTQSGYIEAKKKSEQAMADYNQSFNNKPDYQTVYDNYKKEFVETDELAQDKSLYEKTKNIVDSLKIQVGRLNESVRQQFGGTGLTQAQRDKYRDKQYEQLNSMFTQYNADYQVQFENYSDKVDKAFERVMTATTNSYNDYWSSVNAKFKKYQLEMDNANTMASNLSSARLQHSMLQSDYDVWEMEQEYMQMQREFTENANRRAERMRQIELDIANTRDNEIKRRTEITYKKRQDINNVHSGQMKLSDYLDNYKAGAYEGAY